MHHHLPLALVAGELPSRPTHCAEELRGLIWVCSLGNQWKIRRPPWAVERVGPNLQNKQQPSTEPAYQRKESEKNRNERREREKGKEKRERHKQRINPPTPWAVERVRTNLQKKQQPSTDAVHVVSQASWFLVYLTLHGSNIVGKLSSGSCFALGSSGGLSAFPLFSLPFFVPRVTFSRCGHWMDCEFALELEWL